MVFILSGISSLSLIESLQMSLLGMLIVFVVLVILFLLIRILRSIIDWFIKPPAETAPQNVPSVKPQVLDSISAGNVRLNSLDDKTAAILLSIAADESGIPLNQLKVKQIREINSKGNKNAEAIAVNKKYVFKIGRESKNNMKYNITLNGKVYEVEVERGEAELINIATNTVTPAVPAAPSAPAMPAAHTAPAQGSKIVSSPLPGTVLNIAVKPGDIVKAGQVLMIVEAMKMENEIPAPVDGRVAQILVSQGASINTGDALATLE